MINYAIYHEITQKLSEINNLTKNLSIVQGNFYEQTIKYLQQAQALADKYNLYFSSDIALIIAKLITFKTISPSVTSTARKNIRKEKDSFAVVCLSEAHKLIKDFLDKDRNSFEECKDIFRQVLARAFHKGLDFSKNSSTLLDDIITTLKNDSEFLPYYSHIVGLIGVFNAKIILDYVLTDFKI